MKKELLLSFILIFFHTILSAQTGSDTTIFIPEVELEGTKATQSPGMVIIKVDSVAQVIHQHNTIAELLSQHSGLNIRNYGSGLLSTINSRGLGANHTSVSWNGIPLNSANLGLTDLSLLPVFFFDDVAIVSGGTGSVYGNNAMGTAIELLNKQKENTEFFLTGMVGDHGVRSSNIKFNYINKNLSSSSALFLKESKNNFIFRNISKQLAPIEKQKNASQNQIGLLQIIKYKINNSTYLKSGVWYQYTERELPPLMFSNFNDEHQRDSSLRIFGEIQKTFNKINLSNNVSYFNEYIFYDNFTNKINGKSNVKIYRNEIILKYFPNRKLSLSSSLSGEITKADIKEYQNIKSNYRFGINFNSKYQLHKSWVIGAGIKKEINKLTDAPAALSAGAEGVLLKNLLLSANVSQIYTLPTLNDLFWKPGGNVFLEPETGINTQLNLTWKVPESFFLSITGFYSLINDWIQWLPNTSGIYSPQNIKRVESSGFESSLKQEMKRENWKFIFSGNYSFANTINKSIINNSELLNRQLIYVPKHNLNLFALISYKEVSIYASNQFTGKRFTNSDNSIFLEPYFLINTGAIVSYKLDIYRFTMQPEIRNLLNVAYQPIPWRAMPGRSYFLTLNLSLTFKSK